MLTQAIKIDQRFDQAYSELAKAYRGLGQTGEAIQNLERAAALNPQKPEYHYALAVLYRKIGQKQEANLEMKKYAAIHKGNEQPATGTRE